MLIEFIKFLIYSGIIVIISKYVLVTTLRKLAETLNLKPKTIKLVKKDFVVPAIYEYKNENVVPMYAGETISWSIDSIN